ncbi:hypothetical protein [Massilia sp. YIM B04103]|uniref:hypothetical protein n=1 Tax=Massilia sp. YIM B04103 TaxID=2963106 RepID=UPI00210AB350|nr:hypothetical protein [Massilia sp. YIM B04103]
MTNTDIQRFAREELLPRLGGDYALFSRRDAVRLRGSFAQSVLLGSKRSGNLLVIPTFYVVGARPDDECMHQTLSLPVSGMDTARKWHVRPDQALDAALAQHLIGQMEKDSPLSFVAPLDDAGLDRCLGIYLKKTDQWIPALSRAFLSMCRGLPQARAELDAARRIFLVTSRFGLGGTPVDWENAALARFDELASRLERDDCIALCRADAEAHAQRMRLPALPWPAAWPAAVPPWPAPAQAGGFQRLVQRLRGAPG